jgi:hypothetical protein
MSELAQNPREKNTEYTIANPYPERTLLNLHETIYLEPLARLVPNNSMHPT